MEVREDSMRQLIHNGVLVPKYEWKKVHILIKDMEVELTPEQEEMAFAWVKKLGTEYVQDKVFTKNFFGDFCKALKLEEILKPEDFDFSVIRDYVEKEMALKLNLSKEEKKKIAEQRKALREVNKEKYGYAIVDGVKTEISNYTAEPSCIFMGRGEHPRRGQWKSGPKEEDITLNLSPDGHIPEGSWKEIVWDQKSMWIAKWQDKLQGKIKYVWLADSASVKQDVEIKKFNNARELESRIEDIRAHIWKNLQSKDLLRRKIATVCYLIDALKLRVGDEKDKDEADTIGATTLRPEHIKIYPDGLATFDFLGKDSVKWHKEIKLPEHVVDNIKDFIADADSSVFKGVRSQNVSEFLNEVMPDLTAKVFRTYHASKTVKDYLWKAGVSKDEPEYVKKTVATLANLEAAIECNHKRKPPKNWEQSLAKNIERLKKLKAQKTRKSKEKLRALRQKIIVTKKTKDYNLRTSLKSYIDPRAYYDWGRKVDYDWKLHYPKTLQKKFSWVETALSQAPT